MNRTTSDAPCFCSGQHTAGAVDERRNLPLELEHPANTGACSPEGGQDPGHELKDEHDHKHSGCCGHMHSVPEAINLSGLARRSATRAVYRIMNMDCPMEEALIRKKLGSLPGITGLEFNLVQRVLTVDHKLPSTKSIEAALNSIDMKPEVVLADETSAKDALVPASKIPWGKLAVAGFFALLSEMLELALEWHWSPFGLNLSSWKIGGAAVIEWLPPAFALTAILLGGLTTYKKGWISLKNMNLNINALMSVAVTGAILIGRYPEAAMVMVLFNLAEALEAKSLDRARKAVKNLLGLAPEKATMQSPDGSWAEKDIRDIPVGSRVRVRPGERVALDGLIVQGQSTINQAPITGESLPVEKAPGDAVYAGTINESGSFEFTVSAAAANSTLARIIHAVEDAQSKRAPIQRFIDRFSNIYTPAVFLLAILIALVPPLFLGGSWSEWIYMALVLLVIGCPCALVISTPVSIVSGLAAATRQGILVKGGLFLEQGRRLNCLALDKTGTITRGKPSQTDFREFGSLDAKRAITLAASLAERSDHPVSRAIAEAARKEGVGFLEVLGFTAVPGQGIRGVIDGQEWSLGNHRMVEELQKCSPELEAEIFALEKQGKSVVLLSGEQGVQGIFAVADTIKENSLEAIRELKKLGLKTVMLTGDNQHTAEAIARQVGIDDFQGNLLPEDKLAAIERLSKLGTVGMVGDGINDAPALAKADVGFAMAAAGTDTAIETADVAIVDDDLRKIPRFIKLSKSTHAILAQNIVLALGVKALFFGLAFAGQATMWMAVFADVGTSLLVVANGLRAIRK